MKTKLSQKEWNDKRDAFLCVIIQSKITDEFYPERWINDANQITSELYEVEEQPTQKYKKAMFMGQEFDNLSRPITESNPQPNMNPNEQFMPCSFPPKQENDHFLNVGDNKEDTRPFNPRVVEIFNQYLPKEIAPLAIETHKRSCERYDAYNIKACTLESALHDALNWGITKELGDFGSLYTETEGNTITATPEQLREWFPEAYKGGENE